MWPAKSDNTSRRWLFADQLGPHFLDRPDQPVLLVESRAVFRRRRFHRQKAHLLLSALRHRAAELGEQALYLATDTYREALDQVREPLSVCAPTSYAAERFVHSLDRVEVLPSRGFVTSREDFERWAAGRGERRLLLEDFYRDARRRHDVLMDGNEPAGGRWNYDADNREPPPAGADRLNVPAPWWAIEDDIDEKVRHDLDRWEADGDVAFVGRDGARWAAASREEAPSARSRACGSSARGVRPVEDACSRGDATMAHSMLFCPDEPRPARPDEAVRQGVARRTGRWGADCQR